MQNLVRDLPVGLLLPIIHHFEQGPGGGFAATPYNDPTGKPTIGYGHLIEAGESFNDPLDQASADALVASDLANTASNIGSKMKAAALSRLNDNQYAAIISFVYNIGIGLFAGNFNNKASTIFGLIQIGQLGSVPDQFGRWVFGGGKVMPGLILRRDVERLVWLGSTPEAAIAAVCPNA